jgi:hypothetical protein
MDVDAKIEELKLELVKALETAIAQIVPPDERQKQIDYLAAYWPPGSVVRLRSDPGGFVLMTVQQCCWEDHTNVAAIEVAWLNGTNDVRVTTFRPEMLDRHIVPAVI